MFFLCVLYIHANLYKDAQLLASKKTLDIMFINYICAGV